MNPGATASGLATRTDVAALAQTLLHQGRVRVPAVLEPSLASQLHDTLRRWPTWARVTRVQGEHRSFDAAAMDRLDEARRRAFAALVDDGAQRGFQYLFDRFPLVDHGRLGRLAHPVLLQLFAVLRSEAFLALGRSLLKEPRIRFVDGQLTRYGPGHFLSSHDDEAPGLHRVGAYVINLSPDWPAADGGALEFLDGQGALADSWAPGYNSMSLFRVPAAHRVAAVSAHAQGWRFAVTGWFRTGDEPPVQALV